MRSRSRSTTTILLALIGGAVLLGTAAPALAAETANSEFVLIRPDDVLEGDLYAGAIKVSVDGEIDGDLIAFAGEEIIIEGTVTGSVFAVAPRVTVNGSVGGSLRVVATSLTVNGDIGRDIVATAVNVRLGKESKVGGDVLVWAFSMDSLGQIGQNLEGSQRRLSLAGTVGGDVDVSVGRLTIVDDLTVNGDLGYRSDADAEGLDQADVGGAVVHKTPLPPNIRVRALNLFGRFLAVLFLTIAALTTAWGWPNQTIAAIERVRVSPMRSWMSGAVIMALPLFLMALAALLLTLAPTSASFPLLVILAPLILAAVGLVFALSLVAGVPTVGRLGGLLLKKLDVYGAILTGSVVIGIIWMLPVIGWLVPLFVLPLGLGAWLVSRRSSEPTADADEVASNAQADPG